MGRGVLTFSISSAMAFASYTPTQMGSTVSLPTSLSSTIGIFETGSIISPRIFISTSIKTSKEQRCFEGARLQPRRSNPFNSRALAPEGGGHFSHQTVREASRNQHPNVAPSRQLDAFRHRKVHHLNLRRPPHPLSPRRILPFHHHLKHLPHMPLITMRPDRLLFVVGHSQPPSFLRIRNRVIQPQGRSIRPRRVLKRKHAVIPHHVHQAKRLFKLRLRLARKSNNQIAGKRYIAPSRPNPRDPFQILVARIEPLHGIQNTRRPALHRQMHMVAKRRHGIYHIDNVAPKIPRMRSSKPHPPNPHDRSHSSQQLSKALNSRGIAVRVNVLPQQLNLRISQISQRPSLVQHRRRSPAPLLAARVRHHAVSAELVAPLNNSDVPAMRISPSRKLSLEALVSQPIVQPRNPLLASLQLHQHLR